jgi:predicted TIM-barrel fold metal-dependent hydrolase
MIVDLNAYLGPFAFRRLRHNSAPSLLKLMDAKHIDKAAVSSAAAITYRNTQTANEDLAEEVEHHRDRLIPFAVINPFYTDWRHDLKTCHEKFGMTGLRLYPKWHNYELADACCLELINAATERGMVVSIPIRAEDHRQRSWLADVPDIPLPEIVALVKTCPNARFVLMNGIQYVATPLGRKDGGLPSNYVIEISRLDSLIGNEIGQLIANLGADRVVFGSGMPFLDPDPALLKLEVLDADKETKEKIAWRNAARWLHEAR